MKVLGLEVPIGTYNALISASDRAGRLDRAREVYSLLQQEGCTPNVITNNAMITAFGRAGQWQEAMQLLQEMKSKGMERNTITYSSLISACEKSAQWRHALEVNGPPPMCLCLKPKAGLALCASGRGYGDQLQVPN